MQQDELRIAMDDIYDDALDQASLEAFGEIYETPHLAKMVDEKPIKAEALRQILEMQPIGKA